MINTSDRLQVIDNIKSAVENKDFYKKVEIGDPVLSKNETKQITDKYLEQRNTLTYKFKSFWARTITNVVTCLINRNTEISGNIPINSLKNGAIITSNHFSPLENTVIRNFVCKNGFKRLNIVSQASNFAMKGIIGFLMNYTDTIPLSDERHYLTDDFISVLNGLKTKKEVILIYPEQEMWFNYRKPRPLKRGAYHFAAKIGLPILSCFVEIIDLPEKENEFFRKVKYRLHILDIIYPDEHKTVKENSILMCEKDYSLKKDAYEKIYGKKLTYEFETSDIAGWIGNE